MRQIATLSDVCEINPKHSLKGLPDEIDVSFVAMADVSEITKSIKNSFQKKLGNVRKGFTHFLAEDVLVAKITPCYENGKMAIVEIPNELGFGSTEFHVFRPYKEKIIPKFLFYFLDSPLIRRLGAKNMTGSAGQKRVPIKFFRNLQIPLPSIEEQKRIVRKLDEAAALRQKRKEAVVLLDDYLKAVFLEMFGDPSSNPKNWEETSLGEACYSIKDGPHVSPNYVENGVPFISVNNIIKGWDFTKVRYISEVDHREFTKKSKPEKGDVLYTKGGTTGFAKYIDLDIEFSNWVHLAVLKFDKTKLNGIFLERMLNTDFCYRQSQAYTRGIANRDLVLGQMKKIKIYLPPLAMQEQFTTIVLKASLIKEKMQAQSKELEISSYALMQEAFNR